MPSCWRFGDVVVDGVRLQVRRDGHRIPAEPMVARLLAEFAASYNQLIPRDELHAALWDGRVVSDGSLPRVVSQSRATLRRAEAEIAIRTEHGVGYGLFGSVARVRLDRDVDAPEALVGRAAELDRIRRFISKADHSRVLVIEGPGGVGRTALIEAASAIHVDEKRGVLLRAGTSRREAPPAESNGPESWLAHSDREAFAPANRSSVQCLFVDDLHLLDARALADIADWLDRRRECRVVATFRSTPAGGGSGSRERSSGSSGAMRKLTSPSHLEVLRLHELSPTDASKLYSRLLARDSPDRAVDGEGTESGSLRDESGDLAALARGNPYLIGVAAQLTLGASTSTHRRSELTIESRLLADVVIQRVGLSRALALDDPPLLLACAQLHPSVHANRLAAYARCSLPAAHQWLDLLLADGLIEPTDERAATYRFRHELVAASLRLVAPSRSHSLGIAHTYPHGAG